MLKRLPQNGPRAFYIGLPVCHFSPPGVVSMSVDAREDITLAFQPVDRGAGSTSLESVFRLQYPRLVSVLARMMGDRSRSEEPASEVFCRLSSCPALFRPESNLDAWPYRTAIDLAWTLFVAMRAAAVTRRPLERVRSESWLGRSTLRSAALRRTNPRSIRSRHIEASLRPPAAPPSRRLFLWRTSFGFGHQEGIRRHVAGARHRRIRTEISRITSKTRNCWLSSPQAPTCLLPAQLPKRNRLPPSPWESRFWKGRGRRIAHHHGNSSGTNRQ